MWGLAASGGLDLKSRGCAAGDLVALGDDVVELLGQARDGVSAPASSRWRTGP
jgi:hypothetical protein